MDDFENKVAVITGAASGIGEAIAKECIKRKMKVVLADINGTRLASFEKELKESNHSVKSIVTDVSNESDMEKLAAFSTSSFGEVNLLFNNAGVTGPLGSIWEVNGEGLQKVIKVNLMSVIYGLRLFIPIMINNKEGYIVNM